MVGMKKVNLIAWAHRHGISNNRYWTKDEEDDLINWYGKMSAKAISKKLGRSYRSVIDKLQKIQIGNFIDNNVSNNPTENALINYSNDFVNNLFNYKKLQEISFTSDRKIMSNLWEIDNKNYLIVNSTYSFFSWRIN